MLRIRPAGPDDAERFRDIYAYYVDHTAVTFDCETPSAEAFREKIAATLARYPYLAAEEDGTVVGYAYAHPFVGRAAYGWSAETTIYLAPDARGRGIGRALYGALEEELKKMGILNLYACIAVPEEEDGTLTMASPRFHAALGYRSVGTFRFCGYKFGRWYHMIWMEKIIGEHRPDQPPVVPWSPRMP